MKKNILFTFTSFFCLIFGSAEAYNWQQHVPAEATGAYDWQKHIPNSGRPSQTGNSHGTYYGPTHFSNENNLRELLVYGPLHIENSSANGLIQVYGPFVAHNSSFTHIKVEGSMHATGVSFETLEIDGPATLTNVTASKSISIRGPLETDDSRLQDIVAYTSEMSLHNTEAHTITIKRQNPSKKQVVRLTGRTHVDSIVFESGLGEVQVGAEASYNLLKEATTR